MENKSETQLKNVSTLDLIVLSEDSVNIAKNHGELEEVGNEGHLHRVRTLPLRDWLNSLIIIHYQSTISITILPINVSRSKTMLINEHPTILFSHYVLLIYWVTPSEKLLVHLGIKRNTVKNCILPNHSKSTV